MFFLLWACSPYHLYKNQLTKSLEAKGFSHEVIEQEGHHISYWVKANGDKTPLVLVHGFGGSGMMTWSRIIADVAVDRAVILPDLLWFGESHSDQERTLAKQAEALSMIIEKEEWREFDLVGTSYGGFVSLEYSRHHQHSIQKLILIDSPGPVFSLSDIDALNQRFSISSPKDLFVPKKSQDIQELVDICFYKKQMRIPKFFLEDMWKKTSFSLYQQEKKQLLDQLIQARSLYQDVEWRVDHIIWGEFDPIFPLEEAHELSVLTNATVAVIPRTAHCPFVEKSRVFLDVFLPMIDRAE